MTAKEAYESVDSNYDNVLKRLGSEAMIKRFAVKFLDDPTFNELEQALEAGNGEDAFRAAHTMKGHFASILDLISSMKSVLL